MKAEKQQLIHDLLDDEKRRDDLLLAGTRVLRRRRQWRAVSRVGVLTLVLLSAAIWFERRRDTYSIANTPVTLPARSEPEQVKAKSLTDDELLALFPNTPVALATLPDGRKLLIFPRPGDEQRFVTKM